VQFGFPNYLALIACFISYESVHLRSAYLRVLEFQFVSDGQLVVVD
jgi:hypothetical protein